MNLYLQKYSGLFFLLCMAFLSQAQTTDVYTSVNSWTVPATVTTITIKVYGAGGGTGGQDCGAGCSNAAAGNPGYVLADYNVTPGDVVDIYPGGKGANGANSVSGTGGGTGGADSYSLLNFNGGIGGNAGSSGSSGGGGGGGAASVVTINSSVVIVAGGASGGGGMANSANSGLAGSSSISANGTSNTGGNGTTPGGDGGGGGGGGGGQYGSIGGTVYPVGGESAGNGGFRGNNSVTGAATVTTNGTIAWTNAGRIEITFLSTLPVTWQSFSLTEVNNTVLVKWSTATEQNTRDFTVQHSLDGSNWSNIGNQVAAGNSNTERQYRFVDQNPVAGLNYYRLIQQDIDGNVRYSKIITINFRKSESRTKIYPNPVLDGIMNIRLQEASNVKVYNSIGMLIMEKSLSAGTHPFNVSPLSTGIYYLKANGDNIMFVIQ